MEWLLGGRGMAPLASASSASVRIPSLAGCIRVIIKSHALIRLMQSGAEWHTCNPTHPLLCVHSPAPPKLSSSTGSLVPARHPSTEHQGHSLPYTPCLHPGACMQ